MDSEPPKQTTIIERFNVLYGTLEKYNERYVKGSMTVTAALIAVVGWIVTSENIQKIISGNVSIAIILLLVIAMLIWVNYKSMIRVYKVNHGAYNLLRELNYMDQKFYEHHKITSKTKHFGLWINTGIYIFIAVLIANNQWKIY